MKLKEIFEALESLAPLGSQESYDNSGLIVGDANNTLTNALISLDCTEAIVQEAIDKKCNLIISHHPIVFKGLKQITGKNYVERTVIKAIKNDIAIYAIHTNLDNYKQGVNFKIAERLGIKEPKVLAAASNSLLKLTTFVPTENVEEVKDAIFSAGAGNIGDYSECSFQIKGDGNFKGNEASNPTIGKQGIRETVEEVRIEAVLSRHIQSQVIHALLNAHPYEEVAYDLLPLTNNNPFEGAGMIGELETAVDEKQFLNQLKKAFDCPCIRHTDLLNKPIKRVAWCGGAGSFLLNTAKAKQADIFISGDFKYHEFFDAENQVVIADIGHFESEQFTIELIAELIRKKIPTFAPYLTEQNTNPVNYF